MGMRILLASSCVQEARLSIARVVRFVVFLVFAVFMNVGVHAYVL